MPIRKAIAQAWANRKEPWGPVAAGAVIFTGFFIADACRMAYTALTDENIAGAIMGAGIAAIFTTMGIVPALILTRRN